MRVTCVVLISCFGKETDTSVRPLESSHFALLTGIFLRVSFYSTVLYVPHRRSLMFMLVLLGLLVEGISGARFHSPSRRRGGGNKNKLNKKSVFVCRCAYVSLDPCREASRKSATRLSALRAMYHDKS